jgi:hypothetical protein
MLHTHLSTGAGTIDQLVADVPSGLTLTPPQHTKKKIHNVVGEFSFTNPCLQYLQQEILT